MYNEKLIDLSTAESILFIPTHATTTTFVIMIIWLTRNLPSIRNSDSEIMEDH